MGLFSSRKSKAENENGTDQPVIEPPRDSDVTLTPDGVALSKSQVKRATRTRKIFSILCAVFLFISVIFLIMVEIGSISNRPVLTKIWFIKLDLSSIVPVSIPNAALLNSITRTLGLHDFYQVGLWGYCEGYNNEGVTECSKPQTLYWFNPVDIIVNQLIAGATIALPSDLTSILDIIQVASLWMFAFFLTGACLSTVLIPFVLCAVYSRWTAFLLAVITFINALVITAASVIGTVMFIIMQNVFANNGTVNIGASIGVTMFALMWVASAFAIFTFIIQLCLSCCCASRRDIRKGKKKGNKKAYIDQPMVEK